MLKLFVRLYIFIIVALLLITTLLDSVLLPRYQEPSTTVKALIELIKQSHAPDTLEEILENSNLSQQTQWLDAKQIALPKTHQSQLTDHPYTITYSDKDGQTIQHIYINFETKLLRIDIPQRQDETPFVFYLGILFSLFAIALGLWLWPLWQELLAVKRAADTFNKSGQFPYIKVSKSTTLSSVLNSFNALTKRIQELLASQQALSGTLAHEIRTPLARLKFRLEQLPPQHDKIKSDIQQDIDGMQTLLQSLLDYTRMQCLNPELNIGTVPLHTLTQELIRQWPVAPEQQITVTTELSEQHIMADGVLVERALANLLSNAYKYTNGKIHVSLTADDDWVSLSVHDNGLGIDKQNLQTIFQPFVQLANTNKKSGAGIGLALVSLIQQWHEGTAEVSSIVGEGTTFTLKYAR